MNGWHTYSWNGKPIKDIRKFCKEHNSEMVKYKNVKRFPNLFNGKIDQDVTFGEMPAIFFDSLRQDEKSGMFFEVNRYKVT